jgi:hypothetical protein
MRSERTTWEAILTHMTPTRVTPTQATPTQVTPLPLIKYCPYLV